MPFPLAHPAAVLPLLRHPFVPSALVAGALAPDLLYIGPLYTFATRYIHGNFTLTLTHEFTSALWLDPLLALLALLVFHLLLKRPLIALAPPALAGRLPAPQRLGVFWTVVSVFIGGFTHVLWDSFTHGDGYFVQHWSFLSAAITPTWDVNRVLQYVSSAGGIAALAIYLFLWWRRTTARPSEAGLTPAARYVVLTAACALALAFAALTVMRAAAESDELVGEAVVRFALTGLASGAVAALAVYVLVWQVLRLRRT
ncbi:hypothetical protein BWI15_24030 [Kribbella sp. ALI-6-A]|uniref:DUF4184 family protein n=1 Tax=Kribbella sp. ALI-6-A TaxID=1933817 RepID=UPI00097BFC83|nr:DUF4184 family protein [Kribbella sp. ALI-6-A]ONI69629.1 hypothetical protein BWI15_24030 [Kribbella sp. ALI-6-A]